MITDRVITDETLAPSQTASARSPLDSSQLLLGLMAFARGKTHVEDKNPANPLSGVISLGVLRSLLSALQYRDVATVQHSRRVAMLSVGMAHFLGWDSGQQKILEVASLLHDIGKIGVPDNILFKPGKLSPSECELMSLHHTVGVDVLQACGIDRRVVEIVAQSRNDCRPIDGEPVGSRTNGSEVSLGARILAVADAYDSLATNQVYRAAKSHQDIMKTLGKSTGKQFDGNIVTALDRWVEDEGLPFVPGQSELNGADNARGPILPEEAQEAGALGNIFSYLYVLESLYDAFYLVNSDLKFVVWNAGCERMFGIPAAGVLGQSWTSRVVGMADESGKPLSEGDCPMRRVIESGKPSTSNQQILRSDGKSVLAESQSVPLFDTQGQLQGVAEIFRDLSKNSRRGHDYRALKLAASRDALTSVANRGELEAQLATLLEKFARDEATEPFSIIFLDVDFFKNINDTFGHIVGDEVLVDIARLLQHETYSGELVARYGGEEFVIICPATPLAQAVNRAERLRIAVTRAEASRMGEYKVTGSFGVTEVERGDTVESLLGRADKALYTAKETGRNRTCSLTRVELQALQSAENESGEVQQDNFVFEATFQACVAADMIAYKLGGFVSDHNAKLIHAAPGRACIRVGRRLLPYWGSTDSKRPVDLILEFGDDQKVSARNPRSASAQITVKVEIRPRGAVSDPEVFQARARRLLKLLRSYFAAM
jgi:diguanylate cyclase (GGDEF)-like protein/putative nucleotidyltransferase with HDIG domain/PAS domain S-box-containing protein